ncbi:MAG: hypothetical protein L0338_28470 [Acidobacteria bacterium]|nr:hypothetical protein [Acidobacteriota bacterium]
MADELETLDVNNLTMEQVKALKNQAVERLKAAGDTVLAQSHQNGHGQHSSHTDHNTRPPIEP